MSTTMIPRYADDRIALGIQRGYYVNTRAAGCMHWFDECRLRRWPYVVVLRDGRRWRFRVEMEGWRFTDIGQRLMTDLLAEHGAAHVMVGPDYAYGYKLQQWQAELIAGRLMHWVRERLADLEVEATR